MASLDSPNADSDVDTNPNSNSNSSRAIIPSPSPFPTICLLQFAENSIAGALMGSILGYGSGLFKRKGFKGSFADAGASAKTFAAFSGVHGLVICLLKRLRGKHDIINSGVAGCCTGLAISIPGAPQALLQSCLMYGAFSCIMEGMNKQQPALAHSLSVARNKEPQPLTLALPLSLPIPEDFKNGFSSFLESLKMAHKGRFPTAN